jgi:hypothetical protein
VTRLVPIVLFLVSMAIALWLWPYDSDGAFAVHDPLWYGMDAERSPAGSINPHHPLFHVLVVSLTSPLRALGIEAPGHVASRIVAGLGAAWILLQICALAGRRRVLVGAAFAGLLTCTRGFIAETASGENVLPAAAAALFALTSAAKPGPNLWRVGGALALAAFLRQDNVFLAPAVAAGLAAGLPRERRWQGLGLVALGVGLTVLAGYGAAWAVAHGPEEDFKRWMLRFGLKGAWTGPKSWSFGQLPLHVSSFAVAMVGRQWPRGEIHPWLGIAYAAAMLLPAFFLRGTSPNLRLVVPFLIALLGRTLFFSWFEADNYEWLMVPAVLIAAFGAGHAHGEPATKPVWRGIGIALIAALAAWILVAHGPWTWRLRERHLSRAVRLAADVDRSQWRFIAYGGRVATGLRLIGIPEETGEARLGHYVDIAVTDLGDANPMVVVEQEVARHPIATIVIADRFVNDGMPDDLRSASGWALDTVDHPGCEIVRIDGLAIAGRWRPESRAESGPR